MFFSFPSTSFVLLMSHYFPSVFLSLHVFASLAALPEEPAGVDRFALDSWSTCTDFSHTTRPRSLSPLWIAGVKSHRVRCV